MFCNSFSFTVSGTGSFPVELLSAEECFPESQEDVVLVFGKALRKNRRIKLVSSKRPNYAAWLSRGWFLRDSNYKIESEDYTKYHTWPC
tara:strand:+ start:11530 stop:11796 length:267 start_codon:yes stop_codon:yes gene_type:complete